MWFSNQKVGGCCWQLEVQNWLWMNCIASLEIDKLQKFSFNHYMV